MLQALREGFLSLVVRVLGVARQPVLEGTFQVAHESLSAPVSVHVDEYGVPHIYADNERDAVFAQGWAHAANRLWQMEGARRALAGRVAELADKPEAIALDRVSRTLRLYHIGAEDFQRLPDETKAIVQAYTAGINAYLASPQFRQPVEFTLAGIAAEAWTVEDVVGISRIMAMQMSHGWFVPLLLRTLERKLGEAAHTLLPGWDTRRGTTLPTGVCEENRQAKAESEDAVVHLMASQSEMDALMPGQGSNAFAVSGEHTASGKPMLASDPHLRASTPTIWYQVHLVCRSSGLDVAGVSVPGMPMVVMGHNVDMAWGITLSYVDVADVYEERAHPSNADEFAISSDTYERCKKWKETIYVKGGRSETLTVRWTRHGPLLSDLLEVHNWVSDESGLDAGARTEHFSLQACFLQPGTLVHRLYQLNKARCWDELATICRSIETPSLNFVAAFTNGDIAYHVAGHAPLRRGGATNSARVLPGYDGKHEWEHGYIPGEEMPFVLNPKQGFIVSANHKIAGEGYPHNLGPYFLNGARGERISKLIREKIAETGGRITKEHMREIMCDVKHDYAGELVHRVLAALPPLADPVLTQAVEYLREFDGTLSVESVPASVYTVLRYYLFFESYGKLFGRKLALLLWGHGPHEIFKVVTEFFTHDAALLARIYDEEPEWIARVCGSPSELTGVALQKTVEFLMRKFGTLAAAQYGKLHTLHLPHKLGGIAPIFSLGGQQVGGDADTPQAMGWMPVESFEAQHSIPTFRQVVDCADVARAQCIVPGGQCGHIGNRHYNDRTDRYAQGRLDAMLFNDEDVSAHTESKFVLNPTL